LAGPSSDDSVTLSRTQSGPLTKPTYKTTSVQTLGSFSVKTDAISGANSTTYLEANYYNSTLSSILAGNTLNDTFAAVSGDLTSAMEWDVTIANGSSLQISKLINVVVPEPSSMTMLWIGLATLAMFHRNRWKFSRLARNHPHGKTDCAS
jgi:hypothetical protein